MKITIREADVTYRGANYIQVSISEDLHNQLKLLTSLGFIQVDSFNTLTWFTPSDDFVARIETNNRYFIMNAEFTKIV